MSTLSEKVKGALYGQAIGDGMGAPVEGWPPETIARRFSDVREFLPPTHEGDPATGKGDGRFTDDTLMTEALIRAYIAHQDHLDAYDFERFMLPEMAATRVWVPERQQEMPILDRLFWPEKYPWIRIKLNNADPRTAGVGNRVNCGVAMYMMPIGAVNAGDPHAAYDEAAMFAAAHNESFAVEAGAVTAAAFAAAFAPEAIINDVIKTALNVARDGTRLAINAAINAASPSEDIPTFVTKTRKAVLPFDPQSQHLADDALLGKDAPNDGGRPSRVASIEELPVSLAALKYGDGDFFKTLQAAGFYGRDCDSIAAIAAGLFGATFGVASIPEPLRLASDEANRRNLHELAERFISAIRAIFVKDRHRFNERSRAIR